MFWPDCVNLSVWTRLAGESNTRGTSLIKPRALITPVPVSWLGDAPSVCVVSVPPPGPKLTVPEVFGQYGQCCPTKVMPLAVTLPLPAIFSVLVLRSVPTMRSPLAATLPPVTVSVPLPPMSMSELLVQLDWRRRS